MQSQKKSKGFEKIYKLDIITDRYKNLPQFLKKHKEYDKPNVVSLNGGKYYIPDEDLDDFYMIYYHSWGAKLHLAEMHREDGKCPILLDFDLHYDKNITTERVMKKEHVKHICSLFTEYILDKFENNTNVECIALRREEPYTQDNLLKDGLHVVFPYVVTEPWFQGKMRFDMIQILHNYLFNICNFPLVNEIDKIYDDMNKGSGTPWLMFGSSKKDRDPYLISYYTGPKRTVMEYVSVLSIRNKGILSNLKEGVEKIEIPIAIVSKDRGQHSSNIISLDSEEGIEILKFIDGIRHQFPQHDLEIVRLRRCESDNGIHVFAQTKDHYCPFVDRDHKRSSSPIYLDVCQNGASIRCYDTDCHGQHWPTSTIPLPKDNKILNMLFKVDTLNINYKEDIKHEFFEFENDSVKIVEDPEINTLLLLSLNGTHYDIAKLMYKLYSNNYRTTGLGSKIWFEYTGHRWIENSVSLRSCISEELVQYYKKARHFYKNSKNSNIEEAGKKHKVINDLIKKLKTTNFKNNVLSECTEIFFNNDKTFMSRLNSKTQLMGFDNGVYDLDLGEFRPGRHDDWISFSVHYNFEEIDSDDFDGLEYFLKTVFPINDVRHYVLKLMASCLSGNVDDELFHIFTGSGANGKSKFIDLNYITLGDYAFRVSISLLTQKRAASNAACPELADKMGKRLGIFQEPDKGDEIKVGIMKEYTGGDVISIRQLYGQQFEFKPQFKLILCCNDLPKIPSTDGGTWRRMRVIEFVSKFVERPNPEKQYEFKIDRQLSEKMKRWKLAYINLLFRYYKIYKEEGLNPPEDVVKFTKQYQNDNDKYKEFVDNYLIKDSNSHLKISEIYDVYRKWYQENHGKDAPKRNEFKKNIEGLIGPMISGGKNHGWKGYKFEPQE